MKNQTVINVDSKVTGSEEVVPSSNAKRAGDIIERSMAWSAGAGFLPGPIVDLGAAAAIQLKMLQDISDLYEVPFSKDAGRKVLASLVGSFGAAQLLGTTAASFIKLFPGVGWAAGAAPVSLIAVASTYALGKVFVHHYEEGGTVLDFDAKHAKQFFQDKFKEGQKLASKFTKPQSASAPEPAAAQSQEEKETPAPKEEPSTASQAKKTAEPKKASSKRSSGKTAG